MATVSVKASFNHFYEFGICCHLATMPIKRHIAVRHVILIYMHFHDFYS